jgi:hypothetical protein
MYCGKFLEAYIGYNSKRFVFLKCIFKIHDQLSFSVKLHHCKNNTFGSSTIVTMVWTKNLIETKTIENYYKFVNLNAMAFKKIPSPNLQDC